MSLAQGGRQKIKLAEAEVPGLIALREEYSAIKPLAGARIAGSILMIKNFLVFFVPVLNYNLQVLSGVRDLMVAFSARSLGASSVYILNDIFDFISERGSIIPCLVNSILLVAVI